MFETTSEAQRRTPPPPIGARRRSAAQARVAGQGFRLIGRIIKISLLCILQRTHSSLPSGLFIVTISPIVLSSECMSHESPSRLKRLPTDLD